MTNKFLKRSKHVSKARELESLRMLDLLKSYKMMKDLNLFSSNFLISLKKKMMKTKLKELRRSQRAKTIWEVMLLALAKMRIRVMKMESKRQNSSSKRRRERRMSSRSNAKFSFLQDTETSIKMFSAQSTTMVWFTMEDLLLTRVSKPQIHPSSQLEVYVNSQEDIKL